MPELPEVRMVVKFLKQTLVNQTINEFKLYYKPLVVNLKDNHDPVGEIKYWKHALHDQKVEDVFAYGKYIIFRLTDLDMISHLRMEGKWVLEPVEHSTYSSALIEAQFSFIGHQKVLRYYDSRRFGTLQFVQKDQWKNLPAISKLGYEPFNPKATDQWLYSHLQRSKKAIKTVLLDQTIILGLGNIYANEVLFAAKINPTRPANEISLEESKALLEASKTILQASIDAGGTTIHSFAFGNEQMGQYQNFLKVHDRDGQNCYECGHKIIKIVVGGRGTYYCPFCQSK